MAKALGAHVLPQPSSAPGLRPVQFPLSSINNVEQPCSSDVINPAKPWLGTQDTTHTEMPSHPALAGSSPLSSAQGHQLYSKRNTLAPGPPPCMGPEARALLVGADSMQRGRPADPRPAGSAADAEASGEPGIPETCVRCRVWRASLSVSGAGCWQHFSQLCKLVWVPPVLSHQLL